MQGHIFTAILATSVIVGSPLAAQDGAAVEPALTAAATDATLPAAPVAVVAEPTAPAEKTCELHVWPTDNYIGINTGLLSGFGLVGAIADVAAHDGRVKTVKDLMRDYLGPDVQMEELNKLGLTKTLKLPDNYRIIIEEPTPWYEDLKGNPELKAKVKAMNTTIKAKKRLTDSKSDCYAELITTHIFYHKAMMYGSNLFTGWNYREFGDKQIATKTATGQVKNPLENFPPKTSEMVDSAKIELRDAYSKDFVEYVDKKVLGASKK